MALVLIRSRCNAAYMPAVMRITNEMYQAIYILLYMPVTATWLVTLCKWHHWRSASNYPALVPLYGGGICYLITFSTSAGNVHLKKTGAAHLYRSSPYSSIQMSLCHLRDSLERSTTFSIWSGNLFVSIAVGQRQRSSSRMWARGFRAIANGLTKRQSNLVANHNLRKLHVKCTASIKAAIRLDRIFPPNTCMVAFRSQLHDGCLQIQRSPLNGQETTDDEKRHEKDPL